MSVVSKSTRTAEETTDPLWIFRAGAGTPEQLLEEVWPYLHMTPEERDLECQSVCRTAILQWNALSAEVRERVEWHDEWQERSGMEILARWARECREGDGRTS